MKLASTAKKRKAQIAEVADLWTIGLENTPQEVEKRYMSIGRKVGHCCGVAALHFGGGLV